MEEPTTNSDSDSSVLCSPLTPHLWVRPAQGREWMGVCVCVCVCLCVNFLETFSETSQNKKFIPQFLSCNLFKLPAPQRRPVLTWGRNDALGWVLDSVSPNNMMYVFLFLSVARMVSYSMYGTWFFHIVSCRCSSFLNVKHLCLNVMHYENVL